MLKIFTTQPGQMLRALRTSLAAVCLFGILTTFAGSANATVFTFTGTISGDIELAANYSNLAVPANDTTTDDIVVSAAASNQPLLSQNRSIKSFTFSNTTGTSSLTSTGGPFTLTLGSGGIVNSTLTTGTTTIGSATAANNANLALTNALTPFNIGGTTGTLTVIGVISGTTFGLTKSGTGTLTLSGTNTYTGGTTISAGTATANTSSNFGTGTITLSGGTLGFGNNGNTGSTVSNAVNVTSASTITSSSKSNSFSGALSGSGNVALNISNSSGAGGTFSPSGSWATYTGVLTVASTSVTIGVTFRLTSPFVGPTSGTVTLNSLVTMSNNTSTSTSITYSFGSLNCAAGSFVNPGGATGAGTEILSIGAANLPNTISSTLADGATQKLGITKVGTGTLTLSGASANTHTGGTILNRGTIAVGKDSALGTGSFTMSNTTASDTTRIQSTDATAHTLGNVFGTFAGTTTTYAFGNTTGGTGNLTFSNATAASLGAGARTFLIDNATTEFDGGFTNAGGSISKTGLGTMIMSGASSYGAGTIISAGTISISADNNLGVTASGVSLNGGTLKTTNTTALTDTHAITVSSASTINIAGTGAGQAGRVILNTANTLLGSAALSVTGSGALDSAGGAGVLVLNPSSTYSGNITLQNGGLIEVGNSSAVGAGAALTLGANSGLAVNTGVTLSNAITVSSSSSVLSFGNGNAGIVSGPITLNADLTVGLRDWYNLATARSGKISGAIGGTGALTVDPGTTSGGVLTLTAASNYSGLTTINSGATLQLGDGTTGNDGTIASTSGITDNGSLIYNRFGTATSDRVVSGSGTLTKSGVGTQTLTGANTYSGTTTIIGGVLNAGAPETPGTSGPLGSSAAANAGSIVFGGGTLQFSAANTNDYSGRFSTAGNQPIKADTNGQNVTFATALTSVGGTLAKSGVGTLTLTGGNSYDATTISAGTLQIGGGGTSGTLGTGTVTDDATLAFNRSDTLTVGNVISGTGSLSQISGGTTILTGANSYVGTTISSGTLQIGNAGTSGTLGTGTVTDNATLAFNRSDTITVGSAISGTGNLTQAGTGTTILTGANGYDTTTISGGTLQIGNGTTGTLGSGAVTDNAALKFNRSNALTVANAISGSGTLTQAGAGTTTLTNTNTYTGTTTISAGVLSVGSVADGGTASNIGQSTNAATNLVFDGGTLQYTGATVGTDRNFTINTGKTVTVDVSTTATKLTLSGASTATNGVLTKIGTGTLLLNGVNSYTGGTNVSTGTLGGSGTVGGPVSFASGTFHAPGNSPGIQTVNGDYNLNSGSTLQIELNGTTAGAAVAGYDQVIVNGAVNLNGGNVAFTLGYAPTLGAGDRYVFVVNDGTDAVNGTFNGLQEGAIFNLNFSNQTYSFKITYTGDSVDPNSTMGNDIVLTNITQTNNTTSVSLASFEAVRYADGTWLQWRTGLETDNLGFNVYREQDGKRIKLNGALIGGAALVPGTSLSAEGRYAWPVGDGASEKYWLEDVDIAGRKVWHGPVAVESKPGESGLQRSARLGEVLPGAASFKSAQAVASAVTATTIMPRDLTGLPAGNLAQQWQLAAQAAIKISVKGSGWVRVTQAQLVAAGLDSAAAPSALQVFAEGNAIPITVSAQNQASFDSGDYIEFYAQGLDTLTTDTRTYWMPVTASGAGGLRVPVKTAAAPGASVVSIFTCTAQVKPRSIYYSSLRNGSASNFFGPVIGAQPVDQVVDAPDLATTSKTTATLDVAVQGVTTDAHKIQVQCNGVVVGTVSFSGNVRKTTRLTVPLSALRSGSNTITLVAQGASDVNLLDSLSLRYPRSYRAVGNNLVFTAAGGASVRVQGFSTRSIHLLDITNPARVERLLPQFQGASGNYSLALTVPGSGTRTLMAYPSGQFQPPALVAANRASSWHDAGHQADLVIIAHRPLMPSLAPLVTLRRHQGLDVEVVDVADVFDEYSYGAHDPLALRKFLQTATGQWAKAPRYLLLAGDSSYDPRNYLGKGALDLVPTQLVDIASMETASDDAIADFNNDGLAEMAVGRLPARTAGEATTMVNKIVGYAGLLDNPSGPSAPQGALLVSDSTRGFNFKSASDTIGSLLPSTLVQQSISRDDGDAATVHGSLINAINQGPLLTSFFGHGSVDIWTGGELLANGDAAGLTNGSRLSLFLPMTCLNGYFHSPTLDSLGESLLKAPGGGAVAVWASSGITDPAAQLTMDKSLIKTLFAGGAPLPLGDAIRLAKGATSDKDVRRTWILMGDPTTQLLPAPAKAAQKAANAAALKALSLLDGLPQSFPLPADTPSPAKTSPADDDPSR